MLIVLFIYFFYGFIHTSIKLINIKMQFNYRTNFTLKFHLNFNKLFITDFKLHIVDPYFSFRTDNLFIYYLNLIWVAEWSLQYY